MDKCIGYVKFRHPFDAVVPCACTEGTECQDRSEDCRRVAVISPADLAALERDARIGGAVEEWVKTNMVRHEEEWAGRTPAEVFAILCKVIDKAKEVPHV